MPSGTTLHKLIKVKEKRKTEEYEIYESKSS